MIARLALAGGALAVVGLASATYRGGASRAQPSPETEAERAVLRLPARDRGDTAAYHSYLSRPHASIQVQFFGIKGHFRIAGGPRAVVRPGTVRPGSRVRARGDHRQCRCRGGVAEGRGTRAAGAGARQHRGERLARARRRRSAIGGADRLRARARANRPRPNARFARSRRSRAPLGMVPVPRRRR